MESFAELAVHMEHIVGTHDIAFEDFNRGRMAHRLGRCDWRSRRGRPAEIGDGKDNAELAAFTGDFIDGHGGLLLLGMGSSESWVNEGLGFQTTYVWFIRVLPKMAGLG
mgnify:CR=1 FL=1